MHERMHGTLVSVALLAVSGAPMKKERKKCQFLGLQQAQFGLGHRVVTHLPSLPMPCCCAAFSASTCCLEHGEKGALKRSLEEKVGGRVPYLATL
jgi:hypothetical protein